MALKLSIITIQNDNSNQIEETYQNLIQYNNFIHEWIIFSFIETSFHRKEKWITYIESNINQNFFDIFYQATNQATGTYLLFLNCGSIIQDNCDLQDIFSQEMDKDILWGNIVSSDNEFRYNYPQREDFSMFYLIEHPIPLQSTLIKRETFEKYGGFDSDNDVAFDFAFFFRTIVKNQCSVRFLPDFMVIANPFDEIEKHINRTNEIIKCLVQQYPRLVGEDNPQLRLPSEVHSAMQFWRFLQNNWFARVLYSTIIKPFNKLRK